MGRILAIDYGQKRVGLAVTDPLQIIANPLTTVHAKDVLSFLKEYVVKEKVACFVVGLPKRMNGEDTDATRFIEPFIKALKTAFPSIPVMRVDERFTSKMASQTIQLAGLKKKDRQDKSLVDKVSACIMLQTYLESIQNK